LSFKNDGTFLSNVGSDNATACNDLSLTQIASAGRAYNLINADYTRNGQK